MGIRVTHTTAQNRDGDGTDSDGTDGDCTDGDGTDGDGIDSDGTDVVDARECPAGRRGGG